MVSGIDPARLDEDAFLAGPERYTAWAGDDDLIDVDPIFGKSFTQIWNEQIHDDPDCVAPDADAVVTPALAVAGYSFTAVPAGVLLRDADGNPVGGYLGCDLAIDPDHQGRGLGAELVLEYALRCGRIPVWDHDVAAYSPAGEQAHRSAHRLARLTDAVARKRALLDDTIDAA